MKKLILINAIIWAIVILVTAYFVKGHENYIYVFGTEVVAATLMNGFLIEARRKSVIGK